MKTILLYIIKRFLTPEKIAAILAGIIANLLRKASHSGNWETVKAVIAKAEVWVHLFNQVYSDDTLTKDEEEQIAKAIAEMTTSENIKALLADPML